MLVIDDLNYLILDANSKVAGGLYTSVSAYTFASSGSGFADADAFAVGSSTSASTVSSTEVYKVSHYSITESYAKADALAKESYGTSKSKHTSYSFSIGSWRFDMSN